MNEATPPEAGPSEAAAPLAPLPAADAAVRDQALDPERSFIVQAPAGSGKTELLIQRMLVLLARVETPEAVVAITFTRKAAGEMRQRLLEALEAAAEGPGDPGTGPLPAGLPPHRAQSLARARAVLERDAARHWRLLELPSRLRIQTIDAFCAEQVARSPIRSGWGAPPAVANDPRPHYQAAARATLAQLEAGGGEAGDAVAKAAARLLPHLDNDVRRVRGLMETLLARRDQWLRHVGGGAPPEAARTALEAALAAVLTGGLARARTALEAPRTGGEDPWAKLAPLAAYAAGQARRLDPGGGNNPVDGLAGLDGLPPALPDAAPRWRALAGWLLTGAGEWRKKPTVREGFPTEKQGGQPAMKAAMEQWLDDMRAAPHLAGSLHSVRGLPPPVYSGEQWAVMEALLLLLPRAVEHLQAAFAAAGEVDYVEVSQAALRVLEEPTEAAGDGEGSGDEPRHILVDEFQDTSRSQFELLLRLTRGWEGKPERTLFLVGDPMQSIYRFREAEVGLFLRARREGLGPVRLAPLTLGVNFRSGAGLVEWVNAAFPAILADEERALTGAVPFAPSTPFHGVTAEVPVRVHPLWREEGQSRAAVDAAEAEHVARIVQEARRERPGGTVAVLVRSRSHLRTILPRLRREGLSFQAVEIEPLATRPLVRDLWALTRALLHPGDRVAWLAVLRAPWCGLTLADLTALVSGAPRVTVWERLADEAVLAGLSGDGRERAGRVRAVMGGALAESARRPLRRWVEAAWLALGGPACLPPEGMAQARAYLDLLERVDTARGGGAERIAESMEGLFAAADPAADPGVQVMSIHKAKGLEFDTVILPGLGKTPPADHSPLLRWMEDPAAGEGSAGEGAAGLLLAPIHGAGADEDPIFAHLGQLEKEKEEHERGRLLYVAATRARHRLHLLGHITMKDGAPGKPPANALLHRLWEAVGEQFQQPAEDEATPQPGTQPEASSGPALTAPEAAAVPGVLRRLPAGWRLPEPPPAVGGAGSGGDDGEEAGEGQPDPLEFSWAGETARHVGTVAHRLLRLLAHRPPTQEPAVAQPYSRPAIAAALAGLGVADAEIGGAAENVERALEGILADERGRWILHPHREAQCEYRVSGEVGGATRNFIIDRTFIDEPGTRWIIDYKTGGHAGGSLDEFLDREQERYREQLETYARLMARLDPATPIRLGLYFPLLRAWREWAPP